MAKKNNDREALLSRMRALAAKTVENGCTEAEAATAAELLGKLLDQYGFDLSELEMKKEPVTENTIFGNGLRIGELFWTIDAIAKYCDVRGWQTTMRYQGQNREAIKFFGRESDCQAAQYLLHLCHTAMTGAWQNYRNNSVVLPHASNTQDQWNNSNRMQKIRREFQRGMACRLAERINALKVDRNRHRDEKSGKTGNDLVVIKNQVVEAAFAEKYKGVNFKSVTSRAANSVHNDAGRRAADKVAINPGVGTDTKNAPARLTANR